MVTNEEAEVEIGHMWITMHTELQVSILGEIEVVAGHRNKGYGTRMLAEWEDFVRSDYPGCRGLLLHVFRHNPDARRLYERLGFKVNDETYHGWNLVKLLE
jgi:ribosomal protein S18 acetylase RimI-like enzyme